MINEPVIKLDIEELVDDLQAISDLPPEQITQNVLDDIGREITTKAKELAPVKTGKLKESITYKVHRGELTVEVGVDYGMFQEFGTASRGEFPGRPYKIRPKNGKYLRFKSGGRWVYAKEVTHPGVKPQPFLRPGAILAMGDLYKTLAKKGQAMILKGPNSNIEDYS
jgi:HK97 gp10 family phage protein